MKHKILCILQLPPPIHGVTIINKYIADSKVINESFSADYVSINFSTKMGELNKLSLNKLILSLALWFNIFTRLWQTKYDCVYFSINLTGFAFYRDMVIMVIIKLFKRKCLLHIHGKGLITSYNLGKTRLGLLRWIFKDTKVILLSKLLYPDMASFVDEGQVICIPNGSPVFIDDNLLRQAIEKRKQNKFPKVLFLSNLLKLKGVFDLLESIRILKNKGIQFEAIFAGAPLDISKEDFELRCKKLDIEGYAKYVGPKYGQNKTDILLNSDIFVFPTLNDAFGVVILEAMQAGLPVVSTIEGAIPEIVDDNTTGYLIHKGDIQALSDKIEGLINNPDLRIQLGLAGREKFLSTFTLDIFEDNIKKAFEQVCHDNKK